MVLGVMAMTTASHAATPTWRSSAGAEFALEVLEPDADAPASRPPVVLYLKNLAALRVGTEDDATLLRDLRRAGNLVVVIDFAHREDARAPTLHRDLAKLRDDIRARTLLGDRTIDDTRVFLVPAGCRLVRDVLFFADPVRPLALDIIHPSRPHTPVGAVLEFSCDNRDRFGNTSLSICSDTILDGAATEGWIVAMADHPVPPPYKGLDPMPECARRAKAAVRTLRAHTGALGGTGAIVPVGFSRGSGMALLLVTTAGVKDFEGFGEHREISSDVQGAVVMSGRFTYLDLLPDDPMIPRYVAAWGPRETAAETWRAHGALDHLRAATVPLFLTINATESPEALHQMRVLRERLTALGSPFVDAPEREPRGHKVPLDPAVLAAMHAYLRDRLTEAPGSGPASPAHRD